MRCFVVLLALFWHFVLCTQSSSLLSQSPTRNILPPSSILDNDNVPPFDTICLLYQIRLCRFVQNIKELTKNPISPAIFDPAAIKSNRVFEEEAKQMVKLYRMFLLIQERLDEVVLIMHADSKTTIGLKSLIKHTGMQGITEAGDKSKLIKIFEIIGLKLDALVLKEHGSIIDGTALKEKAEELISMIDEKTGDNHVNLIKNLIWVLEPEEQSWFHAGILVQLPDQKKRKTKKGLKKYSFFASLQTSLIEEKKENVLFKSKLFNCYCEHGLVMHLQQRANEDCSELIAPWWPHLNPRAQQKFLSFVEETFSDSKVLPCYHRLYSSKYQAELELTRTFVHEFNNFNQAIKKGVSELIDKILEQSKRRSKHLAEIKTGIGRWTNKLLTHLNSPSVFGGLFFKAATYRCKLPNGLSLPVTFKVPLVKSSEHEGKFLIRNWQILQNLTIELVNTVIEKQQFTLNLELLLANLYSFGMIDLNTTIALLKDLNMELCRLGFGSYWFFHNETFSLPITFGNLMLDRFSAELKKVAKTEWSTIFKQWSDDQLSEFYLGYIGTLGARNICTVLLKLLDDSENNNGFMSKSISGFIGDMQTYMFSHYLGYYAKKRHLVADLIKANLFFRKTPLLLSNRVPNHAMCIKIERIMDEIDEKKDLFVSSVPKFTSFDSNTKYRFVVINSGSAIGRYHRHHVSIDQRYDPCYPMIVQGNLDDLVKAFCYFQVENEDLKEHPNAITESDITYGAGLDPSRQSISFCNSWQPASLPESITIQQEGTCVSYSSVAHILSLGDCGYEILFRAKFLVVELFLKDLEHGLVECSKVLKRDFHLQPENLIELQRLVINYKNQLVCTGMCSYIDPVCHVRILGFVMLPQAINDLWILLEEEKELAERYFGLQKIFDEKSSKLISYLREETKDPFVQELRRQFLEHLSPSVFKPTLQEAKTDKKILTSGEEHKKLREEEEAIPTKSEQFNAVECLESLIRNGPAPSSLLTINKDYLSKWDVKKIQPEVAYVFIHTLWDQLAKHDSHDQQTLACFVLFVNKLSPVIDKWQAQPMIKNVMSFLKEPNRHFDDLCRVIDHADNVPTSLESFQEIAFAKMVKLAMGKGKPCGALKYTRFKSTIGQLTYCKAAIKTKRSNKTLLEYLNKDLPSKLKLFLPYIDPEANGTNLQFHRSAKRLLHQASDPFFTSTLMLCDMLLMEKVFLEHIDQAKQLIIDSLESIEHQVSWSEENLYEGVAELLIPESIMHQVTIVLRNYFQSIGIKLPGILSRPVLCKKFAEHVKSLLYSPLECMLFELLDTFQKVYHLVSYGKDIEDQQPTHLSKLLNSYYSE